MAEISDERIHAVREAIIEAQCSWIVDDVEENDHSNHLAKAVIPIADATRPKLEVTQDMLDAVEEMLSIKYGHGRGCKTLPTDFICDILEAALEGIRKGIRK